MSIKAFVSTHYSDVTMSNMASQITNLTVVYSTAYSGADERKHQSSASLGSVRGIHRWPVNSPHKGPVTRKMFPFDDVIMTCKNVPDLTVPTERRLWGNFIETQENHKIYVECIQPMKVSKPELCMYFFVMWTFAGGVVNQGSHDSLTRGVFLAKNPKPSVYFFLKTLAKGIFLTKTHIKIGV